MEKFDSLFHIDASIKADTAYYYEKKKLWELRSNVHIRNLQGDKFDTQLLFWDEAKEQIYSDKPIRIEQADKKHYKWTIWIQVEPTTDRIRNIQQWR